MAFVCHVKYRSVTEIVTCILLTSNQMIFLVQFGINKHSQIFQRLQIALALRARAIFCSLWKICSCLFIPNCTRNHLITYTYFSDQEIEVQLGQTGFVLFFSVCFVFFSENCPCAFGFAILVAREKPLWSWAHIFGPLVRKIYGHIISSL